MQTIATNFPISDEEYQQLDEQFGKLAYYQARQLRDKNSQNNCWEDRDDFVQDLRIALVRAGSYHKRQTYIESSFKALQRRIPDLTVSQVLERLQHLWVNRKRHGANRQKFGPLQELILRELVEHFVPVDVQPKREQPLQIDAAFIKYCKQITWNQLKQSGKKITREKSWRTGLVSLSEYDYLGAAGNA